jgi:hypothetical protein
MDVIDLKALFGDRCRITLDPAAQGQRKPDQMYFVIPCEYGEIYPFSADKLAVMVTSIKVAQRLRREHPELKVHQSADDAAVFLFSPDQFDLVARYVHPRRKRQLSPEQREFLRRIGFRSRAVKEFEPKCTIEGTSRLTTQRSGVD